MTARELHERLTELLHAGYGDSEVIIGNKHGGKPVEVVECRNAAWNGHTCEFRYADRNYPGCLSRVIRLARRPT